jgi:hypothetical protein
MTKADTALAEVGPLTTGIFGPHLVKCILVCFGRRRKLGLEGSQSILSRSDIREEVKVVI